MNSCVKIAAGAAGAALLASGISAVPAQAATTDRAPAAKVVAGKYKGKVYDLGDKPGKGWVRFTVPKKRKYVTSMKIKTWVICYTYPYYYNRYPVTFKVPTSKIKNGRVERRWRYKYTVDGEQYTFKGRVKFAFEKNGRVDGRVWAEFANCGTSTGEPMDPDELHAKPVR